MDGQRTKLVVCLGVGLSVVGVLVTYAVYRALTKSNRKKPSSPKTPTVKSKEVRF